MELDRFPNVAAGNQFEWSLRFQLDVPGKVIAAPRSARLSPAQMRPIAHALMTAIVLIAGLPICATSVRAQSNVEPTAIRHVSVISGMRASPLRDATVLIQGNRITAVGPSRSIPVPKGARIVDGHGMYLIPGLINTHVHVARLVSTPQFDGALALELAYGVTGVREASGVGRERELVAMRERINRGERLAPRLYVPARLCRRICTRERGRTLASAHRRFSAAQADVRQTLSVLIRGTTP